MVQSARASVRAPVRAEPLAFSRPTIEAEEIDEVVACLRSGWITSGPRVVEFERVFHERLGVEAIAVGSATGGLHLALACLDLKPEDEVIVPALTWASTANVVELCGARTVFADVDADTLCLDAGDVERRITPRTRALIPVHFAGQPADLDALTDLARRHGLAIVEDAAHALGAAHRECEIGASGRPTVFSFHPTKNITTGEGGMVVCGDPALAARVRRLRFHGVSRDAWRRAERGAPPSYDVLEPGFKLNLTDLAAALGVVQMKKLASFNERRRHLAGVYDALLEGLAGVRPLGRAAYPTRHAWHLYVVRLDLERLDIDRDALIEALRAENVHVGLHYPALHLAAWYRHKYGYGPGSLPAAERAGRSVLSLPLHPGLEERDLRDVVEALRVVLAEHARA